MMKIKPIRTEADYAPRCARSRSISAGRRATGRRVYVSAVLEAR
jgi:hypothetical protein